MSVLIRPARAEDALATATVRVMSWQAAYRGIVPGAHLDAMTPQKNLDHWRNLASGGEPGTELLVAEEGDRIVGFAVYGAARPPTLGYRGELHATYWLPEATGKGYGTQMMQHVLAGLRRLGHDDMIAWVMEANARGRRFYEHFENMVQVKDSRRSFEIAGTTLWEVAYGLRALPFLR